MFACLEALGADFDPAAGGQSRPLEIGIAADFAGRVELGGADAIAVAAAHQRTLIAGWTSFGH